jgi:hypothetical protein
MERYLWGNSRSNSQKTWGQWGQWEIKGMSHQMLWCPSCPVQIGLVKKVDYF